MSNGDIHATAEQASPQLVQSSQLAVGDWLQGRDLMLGAHPDSVTFGRRLGCMATTLNAYILLEVVL